MENYQAQEQIASQLIGQRQNQQFQPFNPQNPGQFNNRGIPPVNMMHYPSNPYMPNNFYQGPPGGFNQGFGDQGMNGSKNFGMMPQNKNIFDKDRYMCNCGNSLGRKELLNHTLTCPEIQQENKFLIEIMKNEIDKRKQEGLVSLKNLQVIMMAYSDKLGSMVGELDQMPGMQYKQQHAYNSNIFNHQRPNNSLQNNQILGSDGMNDEVNQSIQMNSFASVDQNLGFGQKQGKVKQKVLEMPGIMKDDFQINDDDVYDQKNKKNDIFNIENDQEEQKFNGNNMRIKPSYNDDFDMSIFEQEVCAKCKKSFTQTEQEAGNVIMLVESGCMHQMHKRCFEVLVMDNYPKTQCANCPKCNNQISQQDIKDYLGVNKFNELENMVTQFLVNESHDLVQCKCGNFMQFEAGKVDYNVKDEDGKVLSKEAAEHYSQYRVRCTSCQKNFCAHCKLEPYHTGKTCQQLKDFKNARKCRFCESKLSPSHKSPSSQEAFKDVCNEEDCLELMKKACSKILQCGHFCAGSSGEKQCIPCLQPECVEKHNLTLDNDCDSYCNICFISGLGSAPVVQFQCKHIFHFDCVIKIINQKWPGPRIVFNFLQCTQCKQRIKAPNCPEIQKKIEEAQVLEEDIKKKALERGKFEGLEKHPRFKDKSFMYFNDIQGYSMAQLCYYMCFKCKQPYFGGMKDCANQQQQEPQNFKPEELVCGKCSADSVGAGVKNCKKHGTDFIEFKCKFCCNIAQWFCWGTTHFCESCHTRQNQGDYVSRYERSKLPKCPGKTRCPLKIQHPENGEEYALGCSICRNDLSNVKDF